jgi:glycosyltransferase involved in cell wall biosynthesis
MTEEKREARSEEREGGVLRGLRLLIVADSSTTHTHRWAGWAREAGAVVTVLSPFADPIEGVRVIKFPAERRWYHRIPKARMLLDLFPFRALIREIDPQLIHFHFVSEGGRAFYWDRVNVPMVASTWGQDVIFDKGPDPKAETSLRKMLRRCRLITATTHQLARETARYSDSNQPIYVIPFGVDLARFVAPLAWARPIDSPVTLGFVKWLKPKYGPDILIKAFAKIHAARANTKLILAGRGEMRESLEARIKELNLQEAVHILGRVDHEQVPDLIRSFDVMVMPSVYESETFGVAAIEASASGVPVVASRVGGVPEAVLHEKTGLLVPPRDVESLANACLTLIDNPDLRRRMGEAGRRFVERYYSWPDNTRLMAEVYRAALGGTAPRGVTIYQAGKDPELVVPESSKTKIEDRVG